MWGWRRWKCCRSLEWHGSGLSKDYLRTSPWKSRKWSSYLYLGKQFCQLLSVRWIIKLNELLFYFINLYFFRIVLYRAIFWIFLLFGILWSVNIDTPVTMATFWMVQTSQFVKLMLTMAMRESGALFHRNASE